MAHAHCVLDKQGYTRTNMHALTLKGTHTHTHRHPRAHKHREICNVYCFSTATMVSRTRLNVTLQRIVPVLLNAI
jgi:hypothetical protein